MKNTKVANINVTLKGLFSRWLDITVTLHKLRKQERQVLALLLYYHYLLKQDITNNKILWKMVFDYDTRMKIKEELKMKDYSLQNVLSTLRSKNVIKDNRIVSAYIPELARTADSFKVIFNLNIKDEPKDTKEKD
jgi:hypothetical protein